MNTVSIGRTANANVQNQINISIVFNYLKHHGASYRAEIARNLKLSAPAVSRAIEQLIEQGYVKHSGTLTTESGKKVSEISIDPDKGSVIGVDLLKGECKLGLYDFSGSELFSRKGIRMSKSRDLGKDLIVELKKALSEANQHYRGRGDTGSIPKLTAVCIGIPAAVDADTGAVTGASLFESLTTVNLKEAVEDAFDVTCYVENDVKLAGLAENRLGQGKDHRNVVYVDINDGIGAAIILDHRILRGANGFAGEIGYSLVGTGELGPGAQSQGRLETQASIEALCRDAEQAVDSGVDSAIARLSGYPGHDVRPRHVFEAALEGDVLALELIQKSVDLVAMATLNLIVVINPEIVVMGGDVYEMPGVRDLYVTPIAQRLRETLPFSPPRLELSSLGADACVRGASLFAVESLLSGEYPFAMDYIDMAAG
jgi:predicted NBD/HSP70 family sugar kinase